eukprot:CAMPEP_0201575936 /NCGR_PEP_ID=MMETSP0190_2-20130828/21385_1 /ASSEMBLY_ACC=CAM_ASM_000263 /TAXON_ID=37353 /ORGANISM="Rosalina sp." /LENGTH=679 /DNA_ID=CAMNT_0048006151 /DNA_START=76 /DNA_END=2112 /DNA_ORIENTATION=-
MSSNGHETTVPQTEEEMEEASPLNAVRTQSLKSQASVRLLNFLSMSNAPPSMMIEFKNMNARVPKMPGSKEYKTILNNVSGKIEPGQLVALMGPSGAGKSTLLNVLGSRFTEQCSGQVYINNEPRSKKFKKHIGYVLQHDFLLPNLTVKETLSITANLRLPSTLSKKDKQQRVDDIIHTMGLRKCENTLVQLVSGGENKRVSIANELLINPSILFLDEPTSGLDSTSAFSILTTLQELCRQGRTVICSIHQPSSQMFMKFDKLLLLASGSVIYFGSAPESTSWFEEAGYNCPIHYNPADFILELVTDNFASEDESLKDKEKIKQSLIDAWTHYTKDDPVRIYRNDATVNHDPNSPKKNQNGTTTSNVTDDHDMYDVELNGADTNGHTTKPPMKSRLASTSVGMADEDEMKVNKKAKTVEISKKRWNTSWWEQFKILYVRAFKHRRGHLWSWIRVVEIGLIALLGGLIWFRIAHIEENIQDFIAASFFLITYLMFSVMYRGVVHFPLEREVIKKERQSGAYRLSAYYISKIVAEFPVDIFLPMVACTLFYWLVGMADDFPTFLWYLATTAIALLAANSFGIMCGCSVPTFDYAITILAVVGIFMMALSGFMIKDRAIPEWIRWIKYFSFMRYGYLGGIMVILGYTDFECGDPSAYIECETGDEISGETILDDFGINETYW